MRDSLRFQIISHFSRGSLVLLVSGSKTSHQQPQVSHLSPVEMELIETLASVPLRDGLFLCIFTLSIRRSGFLLKVHFYLKGPLLFL